MTISNLCNIFIVRKFSFNTYESLRSHFLKLLPIALPINWYLKIELFIICRALCYALRLEIWVRHSSSFQKYDGCVGR